MRMGGFSSVIRRPAAAGDPTHALFADQSHSIPDNLVALLGAIRAWHCSPNCASYWAGSAVTVPDNRCTNVGYPHDSRPGPSRARSLSLTQSGPFMFELQAAE